MEQCEDAIAYTLLGFLLRGGAAGCGGEWRSVAAADFLRDYAARGKNALLWIGLIAVTLFLVEKLVRLLRFWAQGRRIPGPPYPSFFGHSKLIACCRTGEDLTGYLSKMHDNYGPIVRIWLGPTQMLVSVKDIAMIKEFLEKAEDKLPLIGRAFRLAFGRSTLFVSSFHKVQRTREALAAYMNENLLEWLKKIPIRVVEHFLQRFDSIAAKDVHDSRSISQHMACYILGSAVFGDAFINWSKSMLYEELLVTVAKDACFWASYRIPPFWRHGYWRYWFLCKKLKELNKDIVEECMKNINVSTKSDQISCVKTRVIGNERVEGVAMLVDCMMFSDSSLERETREHCLSKEERCGNILGLMFHGFLTTASLINSILSTLVLHPELQENPTFLAFDWVVRDVRIYLEIASMRTRTSLDLYDVQKMKLLLATIYESSRLLPPGPLLQRCSLKHDLRFKSRLTVPAGAILVVPLPLVHMDDSAWGKDADQFNPQHFILKTCKNEDGALIEDEVSKGITSELQIDGSFLSFGSGARVCVGQKFAVLELAALFASLLHNYEIRLQPGSDDVPECTSDGCSFQLLPSSKIIFARRNKY